MVPLSVHKLPGEQYSAMLAVHTESNMYLRITPAMTATDLLFQGHISGDVTVSHEVTTRSASFYIIDIELSDHAQEQFQELLDNLQALIAQLNSVELGNWDAV